MSTTTPKNFAILITDDDRGCREALCDIIGREGFQTLEAESGEEALEIVSAGTVHLVLLDFHMPRLTGLETLQLVRQINALLPCILVTAEVNERLMRQAAQARAYSVIPKPPSRQVVVHTVLRALVRSYGTKSDDSSPEKE
jgi:DNA-binding NtrC family response regulator